MINSTVDFRNIINNGKPMFGRIVCFFADGTEKTFEKDDFLMSSKGFSVTSSSSSTSTFDIASVNASSLEVQLINYEGYLDNYDFDGARIQAYVGAELSTGLEEIVNKGIYYVESQDFNSGLVTLTCYDAVAQLDCQYTGERSGTAQLLVTAIASKHGLTLSNSHFNNYNYILTLADEQNVSNYTDREMLRCICEATCNYAHINSDGYLMLEWYNDTVNIDTISAGYFNKPSSDIIEAGNISDMNNANLLYSGGTFTEANSETKIINNVMSVSNVGIADVEITGIEVSYGNDKTAKAGSDGYVLTIKNNPFVNENNAQNIADNIWSVAQNTRFRAMTIKTLCNPLLEIGDSVVIEVGKNLYQTIITNISFAVGQLTTLTTGAASARKNASYSNGINSTERKLQAIASNSASGLANQFANLITQSLGMYEIRESRPNGGEILYLSNKPTLEESYGGTVWRMDLNIFSVTKNYQGDSTVWQAGFDSDGNAIMNVLDVVGINADWISAGVINAARLDLSSVDNKLAFKVGVYDNNQIIAMINASADAINLTANNGGVNIQGDKFTLKSTNTVITANGSIECNSLVATNAKLVDVNATGSYICEGNTSEGYHMKGSFKGGELRITSSDGSYAMMQGHLLQIYDGSNANIATLGRNGIIFQDRQSTSQAWLGVANSSSGYRGAFLQLKDEGGENLVYINTADWIARFGRPADNDDGTGWRYFDTMFYINRPTGYRFVVTSDKHGAYYPDWDITLYGAVYVKYSMKVEGGISQASAASTDSDKNVKKNIKQLDGEKTADFIYSLKPCEFKYINGTSDRYHHGLIAQDVKESMGDDDWGLFIDKSISKEDYVDKVSYSNGQTKEIMTAKYGLRYEELIADLIATVQSQNARITKLEDEINKLKNKEAK